MQNKLRRKLTILKIHLKRKIFEKTEESPLKKHGKIIFLIGKYIWKET